jgi:hypothetical protein
MPGGRREYAERLAAFDRLSSQAMLAPLASFMRITQIIALALTLVWSMACASRQPPPAAAASVNSTSPLCQGALGHFIGLPADLEGKPSTDAPAAGRWWVRSCTFDMTGGELHLKLGGPGWFWVDRREGPLHLRQHVYFRVAADVYGSVQNHIGWKNGIVSVWFKPSRAVVHAAPLGRVHASSDSAAVSLLRRLPLPGFNVDAKVRRRIEQELTRRFTRALRRDSTFVYDLEHSQSDFAVRALKEGTRPEHPFGGGRTWYVNENVLAAPGGVHAFGPFDADEALSLDVRISRGSGVAWRAVCASDVEQAFAKVESGEAARIPKRAVLEGGRLAGSGLRQAKTAAVACPSYVVVSAIGDDVTQAAIRVRPQSRPRQVASSREQGKQLF